MALVMGERLITAHAERIGDPVDIVEPRRDQRDLQDSLIVEADGSQTFVMRGRNLCRILRQLHDVIEHHAILLGDGSASVVRL
jgi:hypothetical protein